MYLKEMSKLTKVFLIIILNFSASGQPNTFSSNLSKQYANTLSDQTIDSSKSIMNLNIKSRFFGVAELSNENEFYSYHLFGLRLDANMGNKLMLVSYYDYLDGSYNSEIKNYQDSLKIYYPGFGLNHNRFQFIARYLPSKFISVDMGYGKQFIGNGYQSLLLSDISSSYPYVKFTTEFGPVRYYNLYTTYMNPDMLDYGRKKHAAIHYLDFAITSRIHLGVFESILWQSKSEEVYKGYELAYLNPVIFYRPVEFSKESFKGNALMGLNINLTFKNGILYGQFLLDDLNISRKKDEDDNYQGGFFQNKYAYQLGFKGEIKNIKYLIEYNQVQPYTNGHRTILQNYSHLNQPLAHPLGANFKELINILEIKKGKWTYKIRSMIANVGLDSLGTHYGQNIFESDLEASRGGQSSYGNFNGQGVATTIYSFSTEAAFNFKAFDVFGSIYYGAKQSDLLDQSFLFYLVGLRTFPFSTFRSY